MFCNICKREIPRIFNGVSYPCPKFRGVSPCYVGQKLLNKEILLPKSKDNYKDKNEPTHHN